MLGAKAIARAKLNLYLEVGARRVDGYHDIRSVMQSLELSDELYLRRTDSTRDRIALRCSEGRIPTDEENIVWRAVEEFASSTGAMSEGGIEVFINKRIPIGAGLAGGSADAAATLLAMDHIWELELDHEALMDIAGRVGSDVPFCLIGGTALVSGRGELVSRLESLPPYQVVLAAPEEEASTAEVYRRFDELGPGATAAGEEPDLALDDLLEGLRKYDFNAICAGLRNDLEPASTAIGQIERYKETALQGGASTALMTGSGPTVFALVSGLEEAAEVAWELGQIAPITIITSFSARGAELSD